MKFGSKIITTAIITCVANLALANQAKLINAAPLQGPITLTYKVAHKNSGGTTEFSGPQTIGLSGTGEVSFSLEGYELAGIVPISVDVHGHHIEIPNAETMFDTPQKCSLTTDANHASGTLGFRVKIDEEGHGKALCFVNGGVFN